jgi:SAM-dependent methyltransferase
MAVARLEDHVALLRCPRCGAELERATLGGWRCARDRCSYSQSPFPTCAGLPALVDFEHSVLSAEALVRSAGAEQISRERPASALKQRLVALIEPRNRTAERSTQRLLGMLREGASRRQRRPLVLVVGGGRVGSGIEALYQAPDIDVLGFDIYAGPSVQFIADAHRIPLADGAVDAVVVQAVLEHVLEPPLVVSEIERVLAPSGLVYADTPFMWPVHEGPYDFTRYTDSGHRYLFRSFELIDSGAVAGAGLQLALSLESFVRSLTRSRTAGAIVRLALFWLPLLDRYLDPRHSLDGAASVYFLGRRAEQPLAPRSILEYYRGAQ